MHVLSRLKAGDQTQIKALYFALYTPPITPFLTPYLSPSPFRSPFPMIIHRATTCRNRVLGAVSQCPGVGPGRSAACFRWGNALGNAVEADNEAFVLAISRRAHSDPQGLSCVSHNAVSAFQLPSRSADRPPQHAAEPERD